MSLKGRYMNIILKKAGAAQREILYRLLQYSLFEESLNDQNDMNEEALFEYPWFENYFTEKDREAFFIREAGSERLLGFVMINTFMQKSSSGHSIAEFMILPKFRRKKIGKKAAVMCFEKYQGVWEVSPSYGSELAYLFWKSVIDDYTGTNNKYEDGIFSFCSQSGRH
ncbi:hypothetical protein IMSAGC009_02680 [Lachnospiraceae bacterium]|nr:hypothetical protein IMSAGC009_02680 [Lachnospiraceae bacterium]